MYISTRATFYPYGIFQDPCTIIHMKRLKKFAGKDKRPTCFGIDPIVKDGKHSLLDIFLIHIQSAQVSPQRTKNCFGR